MAAKVTHYPPFKVTQILLKAHFLLVTTTLHPTPSVIEQLHSLDLVFISLAIYTGLARNLY